MKASETSERYIGKVRECCNYAARSAKKFIGDDKKTSRQPCGKDETRLLEALKADLSTFCDTVTESSYPVSQKAYILSNFLVFLFMLLAGVTAILGYFINELIIIGTFVFSILALAAFFGAFGGTAKKLTGKNIFATRTCKDSVKHRIIIEANLDAPFKRKISRRTEYILKFFNFLLILVDIAFSIIALLITYEHLEFIAYDAFIYISFITPLFAIIPIVLSRSVIITESTPGVTDNLLSCYTACGALRYMSEMELKLDHTELCVLLTGSKNANMAGAKMYIKTNAEADKAVDTTVVSLNSIYEPETITVLSNDKKSDQLLHEAADLAEVKLVKSNPKYLKSTAKLFKKAKISSATITSLTDEAPAFYRSAKDNTENINVPAIEATIKTILEAAYLKDSK